MAGWNWIDFRLGLRHPRDTCCDVVLQRPHFNPIVEHGDDDLPVLIDGPRRVAVLRKIVQSRLDVPSANVLWVQLLQMAERLVELDLELICPVATFGSLARGQERSHHPCKGREGVGMAGADAAAPFVFGVAGCFLGCEIPPGVASPLVFEMVTPLVGLLVVVLRHRPALRFFPTML